jgi:hypothetical protein
MRRQYWKDTFIWELEKPRIISAGVAPLKDKDDIIEQVVVRLNYFQVSVKQRTVQPLYNGHFGTT